MNLIDRIESECLKKDIPVFRTGDKVKVFCKVREGDKERIQAFEGVVLKQHRGGARASFTVRKISYGIGVERVFPLHSPRIDKIEVVSHGKVRRSRLYYLRERSGKSARIQEQIWTGLDEKTGGKTDVTPTETAEPSEN
ncbi:MAG: 50S ribosomal protein L19 [Pseudomonadota bacterium]